MPLLPQLEAELAAAERRLASAEAASLWRRIVARRPSLGAGLAAVSVAVTLVVGAVAVTTLHHASPPRASAHPPPSRLAAIVDTYAVFARPQSAADRRFTGAASWSRTIGQPVMIASSTRRAAVFGAYSLYLAIFTATPQDQGYEAPYELGAFIVGHVPVNGHEPARLRAWLLRTTGGISYGEWGFSLKQWTAHPQAFDAGGVGPGHSILFAVVPNGVATVAWTLPPSGADKTARTIRRDVHNNVAGLALDRPPSILSLTEAWYRANGTVIKRFTGPPLVV